MSSTQQRPAGARERLIEDHLPLVRALARRYTGLGAELDDLVQVGAVGLIKASDRFDPSRGVAFATFAVPTIEGEIRHHLRDRSHVVRIPRQLQNLCRDIDRCTGRLAAQLGRSPTVAELAEALKIDREEVERALAARHARDAVQLVPEGEDGGGTAPETSAQSDVRLTLVEGLRALDERERRIVYLRFHADQTERQIAHELGISQAHVSRLLSGALVKLRATVALDTTDGAGDISPEEAISRAFAASRTPPGPPQRRRRAPAGEPDQATTPPPPAPSHSGRFLVRMPSKLHEQLARAAEREQVSLNRFVTDALATTVSPSPEAAGRSEAAPEPPAGRRPAARTIRMVLAANLIVVVFAAAAAVVLLVLALQSGI